MEIPDRQRIQCGACGAVVHGNAEWDAHMNECPKRAEAPAVFERMLKEWDEWVDEAEADGNGRERQA